MCEQAHLGKVYIFVTKGDSDNEWVSSTKYHYTNQNYNLYMHDNDYKNVIIYKDKSEIEVIQLANHHIDDLHILFKHDKKKTLIGGDLQVYLKIAEKNVWLPPVCMTAPKKKGKSY